MSGIISAKVVASGRLPEVEELAGIAQDVRCRLNGWYERYGIGEFVPYGSLPRGDATPASDLDLALVLQEGVDWEERGSIHEFEEWNVLQIAQEVIKPTGLEIPLTILPCSRALERIHNLLHLKKRFWAEYGPGDKAGFSVTTYDHMGVLSALDGIPVDDIEIYRRAQREIRKYSSTSKVARVRDLRKYLDHISRKLISSYNYPGRYEPSFVPGLLQPERTGVTENYAYHLVRKLAGIVGPLDLGDGKDAIAGYLADPRFPLFGKLAEQFDIVYRFRSEYEQVLAESLGHPWQEFVYRSWVDEHSRPMVAAVVEMIRLLELEFARGKFEEDVYDYDRLSPKRVIVKYPDRWFWLADECALEWGNHLSVSWICAADVVLIDFPVRGFYLCRGEKVRFRHDLKYDLKKYKVNPRLRIAEGWVELDLRTTPPTFKDILAKAYWPEHKEAAELAHFAAMAEIRRRLEERGFRELPSTPDTEPYHREDEPMPF